MNKNNYLPFTSIIRNIFLEKITRVMLLNSNQNTATMDQVCWPFESRNCSRILLSPAVPPAYAVPLPLPIGLALPVPFLVFPCDGSHYASGGSPGPINS